MSEGSVSPSWPGRRSLARGAARVPGLGRVLAARPSVLKARADELTRSVGQLQQQVDELRGRLLDDAEGARARDVNHELLKGELYDLRVAVGGFSGAVEDGASLSRAGQVVADVRVGVAELARRLRRVERAAAALEQGSAPVTAPRPEDESRSVASEVTSTLFDYVGFEERFRGDPDVINKVLRDRYVDVLRPHQPVVDIGCGRGELLQLLAAEGLEVIGVEPDPGMAAEARARGIDVRETVADEFLQGVPDGSVGSIISTHVVEHLELADLITFIELSNQKLRRGGLFVAETPNPATLIVLGTHFIMDPTHEWPLHPELMAFLCTSAGFESVRAEFFSPAHTLHLPLAPEGEDGGPLARRVDEGFARLNHVLFGPQDYAVFAVARGGSEVVDGAATTDEPAPES